MTSSEAQQQYTPLSAIPILRSDGDRFTAHDADDVEALELESLCASQDAGDNLQNSSQDDIALGASDAVVSKTSPLSLYHINSPNSKKGTSRPNKLTKRLSAKITARLSRSRFYGWHMGVLIGSCFSALVLCYNIAIVITGSKIHGGYQGGITEIKVGKARDMAQLNTVLHVLINACSTILLAASNYTMQVLSAPTRQDIDSAHKNNQWFEIGILSLRNVRAIARRRAAVWLILALSSIPLHLFYNAAVFQVSAFNEYRIGAAHVSSRTWLDVNASCNSYERLSNAEWREIYGTRYVAEHGDLILAIDRFAYNTSQDSTFPLTHRLFLYFDNLQPRDRLPELTSESWDWIRYDKLVKYASPSGGYSETVPGTNATWGTTAWPVSAHVAHAFSARSGARSSLRLSLVYMLVVIAFNFLKLSIMIWTLLSDRSTHLVTIGDAAVSFLECPDPTTVDQCMLGKDEMRHNYGTSNHVLTGEELESCVLRVQGVWLPQRRRYFDSVHRDRQIFYVFTLCVLLSGTILIPLMSWRGGGQFGHLRGWGTSSGVAFPIRAGTLLAALLVNIPQMILSIFYIALNSICTAMASAHEWDNLANLRKGLRVTKPEGEQRSTYFLQLPYRWAMPLMATSGILHWLLSQSCYLVRWDMYDRKGRFRISHSRIGFGFSSLSLWIFTIVALLLVCMVGYIGSRSMQQKLPTAASCSLVISAACHSPSDEQDTHLKKVKWGVVEKSPGAGYTHCSLAARQVRKPTIGVAYH